MNRALANDTSPRFKVTMHVRQQVVHGRNESRACRIAPLYNSPFQVHVLCSR